jgi:tetratricopeptide (TPR) repeat protein
MSALVLPMLALMALTSPPASLRQVLESCVADSLIAPLTRFEATHPGSDGAEAAFVLGQLHYARGEYRQAAGVFTRATSRIGGARRAEVRYWMGLANLGAGQIGEARTAFEDAARSDSPRRPEALLGVALCWEAARRPERALEVLQTLVAGEPGEAGPAALERLVSLSARAERPELARRARERLAHDYPRSVEAMRAVRGPEGPAAPVARVQARAAGPGPAPAARRTAPPPMVVQVPLAVQIGAFRDRALASRLAERARRAGFGPVRVSALADADGGIYAVRVGVYATAEDARGAGERLGRSLGVVWRVVPAP